MLSQSRRAPGDSMQSEEMARFISPHKNGLFLSRQIQHRQTPTDCVILNGFYSPKKHCQEVLGKTSWLYAACQVRNALRKALRKEVLFSANKICCICSSM